ncbi:MAG: hypothetical protein GX352_04005 [Clostridiales bacterium]|nr:hypothetical protein [Clostridiales bacterium]
MLYIFMGQSCTGKSTMANKVKEIIGAKIYAGKDYLRMAKGEKEAWELFYRKLTDAASNRDSLEKSIIYLIAEKEQLDRIINIKGSYKVRFTATIEVIKSRFAQRMHGRLPEPVEKMLDRQYEEWKNVKGDVEIDTTVERDVEKLINLIKSQ